MQVSVREGIGLDELHKLLESIVRPTGCTACGLLGIDITIRGGDPEFFRRTAALAKVQVGDLKNVEGVAVLEGHA